MRWRRGRRAGAAALLGLALAIGWGFLAAPAGADTADAGDNAHPSGRDRSVEAGASGAQGKARSEPDAGGRGDHGTDKPGRGGGVDVEDQDGNNGCGNDDDFEDDNLGNCRSAPPARAAAPASTATPVRPASAAPAPAPPVRPTSPTPPAAAKDLAAPASAPDLSRPAETRVEPATTTCLSGWSGSFTVACHAVSAATWADLCRPTALDGARRSRARAAEPRSAPTGTAALPAEAGRDRAGRAGAPPEPTRDAVAAVEPTAGPPAPGRVRPAARGATEPADDTFTGATPASAGRPGADAPRASTASAVSTGRPRSTAGPALGPASAPSAGPVAMAGGPASVAAGGATGEGDGPPFAANGRAEGTARRAASASAAHSDLGMSPSGEVATADDAMATRPFAAVTATGLSPLLPAPTAPTAAGAGPLSAAGSGAAAPSPVPPAEPAGAPAGTAAGRLADTGDATADLVALALALAAVGGLGLRAGRRPYPQ